MTRDDIIEMAQSVLLLDFRDNPNDEGIAQFIGTLSDFAELVAAAEQDRLLRIVYEESTAYGKTGECVWIGVKHKVRKKE